jgi:hypothetical protein
VTEAMTRKALAMLALLCACVAVFPAVGEAAVRDDILKDCQDGVLQGSYTPAQLRDARQNLPGDLAQYTDCDVVLRNSEIPSRPGTGGGGTGTQRAPAIPGAPTPIPGVNDDSIAVPGPEQAGLYADALKAGAKVEEVDPKTLRPAGAIELNRSSNTLPPTLSYGLGLLALCGLVAGLSAWRRGRARGGA